MSEPPLPVPEPAPASAVAPTVPPAPDATGEPTAPADLVPPATRGERLAWYIGALLLGAILAAGGMQVWKRDLHAPFYYDLDALLYLPLTRTIVEQGFWNCWHNDRQGWPNGQDLYDFPIIDYLHFAFIWGISRFVPELLMAYNLYSLLTYPLTVLTAMWVLRWLKLTLPAAALGGLLYAFIPYHQERYHYHYFLAAYWWVPVSLVPALAICRGEFPFFAKRPDGTRRWNLLSGNALGQVLVGAVTASAGAYYAFFACATYTFAGAYACAVFRTWRGAASAALVIAPVVAVGFYYHIPTFDYQKQYGVNPVTQRFPEEADSYGLKLAHLLLPANDHNFRPFANVRALFKAPNRPAEGEAAGSLGLIGGIGLVSLLAIALLPNRRRWPEGPLVALTLFLVLLGTIGAFGSLFNFLITPQIRAYNRIVVFIAFPCLFAVLWWLDRFLLTRTGRWVKWARVPGYILWVPVVAVPVAMLGVALTESMWPYGVALLLLEAVLIAALVLAHRPALGRVPRLLQRVYARRLPIQYPVYAVLVVVGYLDQTPWGWNPFNPKHMAAIDTMAERFRSDKRFFAKIEESMPPGSRIHCLPYVAFPESPPVHKMPAYEHARGYVMTDTLYWGFGAVKGREVDAWQKELTFAKPDEMLRRVMARGYDGLLIDGRGFLATRDLDRATALINRLNQLYQAFPGVSRAARLPEIVHEDGKQFFIDIRPYREAYQRTDPVGYAKSVTEESEWVAALWLGFNLYEPSEDINDVLHWGPFDASLVLVNPTDRTRPFDISFVIGVETVGPFSMTISGVPGVPTEQFTLVKIAGEGPLDTRRLGEPRHYKVDLPPGRTTIHFRCRPPEYFLPFDKHNLCYWIKEFKLRELK